MHEIKVDHLKVAAKVQENLQNTHTHTHRNTHWHAQTHTHTHTHTPDNHHTLGSSSSARMWTQSKPQTHFQQKDRIRTHTHTHTHTHKERKRWKWRSSNFPCYFHTLYFKTPQEANCYLDVGHVFTSLAPSGSLVFPVRWKSCHQMTTTHEQAFKNKHKCCFFSFCLYY